MNKILDRFLLPGDKFIPEMYLRQPGFTYGDCGPFTKIEKFKETRDSRYIYQNELDKSCFQHEMAYWDFKNLTRWTGSDKILHDKAFNTAKNGKCDGYQCRLALMGFKYFDQKTSATYERSET